MPASRELGGPRLWALLALVIFGVTGALLAGRDVGEHEMRALLRVTAFLSSLLFLTVFTARAVGRRWPSDRARWVLANRRWLGLSFATSHAVHTYAIVSLIRMLPHGSGSLGAVTRVAGGAGLVLVALMAATSTDAAQRALGAWWGRLHRTGLWLVWIDFVFTYSGTAATSLFHATLTAVFLAAAALRLWPAPTSLRTA